MPFNSFQFFIFFPIVVLLYFMIPGSKLKVGWLLLTSYFFYICWNPNYIVLIFTSTVITYFLAILIEKAQTQRKRTIFMILGVAFNLLLLGFFKYYIVLFSTYNILLPVGISFYTFQILGYIIDVYKNNIDAEKNFFRYALFVSFFPQLLAGPIERAKNMLPQYKEIHLFDYERVKSGLLLMLWGYFQKIMIADRAAAIVNQIYDHYMDYEGFYLIAATLLFALQIYCDFAAYSNIAIGAAEVLGFKFMTNFQRPYFATSIKEFWRRWHISLSSWFKDYVYIPLGGNRNGRLRKYINIMIVFLLSGIWHGAGFHFIVWGGLHGLYQILGECLNPVREKLNCLFKVDIQSWSHKFFKAIGTFLLVDFAWIFFRAPSLREGLIIIHRMFSAFNPWILFDNSLANAGLDEKDFRVLLISALVLLIISCLSRTKNLRAELSKQSMIFRWSVYFISVFTLVIFGYYGETFDINQFIYFKF